MKQSIVEVIVYLLEIAASPMVEDEIDPLASQLTIKQRLENAGFSKEVVANTFDWLKELIEQQSWYATTAIDIKGQTHKTIRIFDAEEKVRVSLEVRNFILSLEHAGILDTKMREIVINKLMQLDQHSIDVVDAKWVVLLVVMSKLNKNIHEIRSYFLATMALEVQ